MLLKHTLTCRYTGLPIGTLEVIATAGTLPYLSHWKDMVAQHPVFSMESGKLLGFAKNEWNRLAQLSANEEASKAEEDILRACFLAILHSLDSIRQDCPALPPMHIVQSQMSRLFALAYWKWYLESKRFRFPTYHISKFNTNDNFLDLHHYFDVCFDVKDDYEKKVTEVIEKEKALAAERALLALNNEWITPVSRKTLWAWVRANLPSRYDADKQGWLSTLFLGGSSAIIEFTAEDLDLFEEIITSECPAGTGIMGAVRKRIAEVKKVWDQHHAQFEIDIADYAQHNGMLVNGLPVLAPDPGPCPAQKDFESRAKFFIAQAQWTIAKKAFDKHISAGAGLASILGRNNDLEAI